MKGSRQDGNPVTDLRGGWGINHMEPVKLVKGLGLYPIGFVFLGNPDKHIVEGYSAIKRNDPLICAITWVDLKSFVLDDRSQMHESIPEMSKL